MINPEIDKRVEPIMCHSCGKEVSEGDYAAMVFKESIKYTTYFYPGEENANKFFHTKCFHEYDGEL